ncbi:cytochrome c [Halomonas sp. G15]|uniref:c-type cytochrome n=1 Tax=Halomonas sp. G15 TaxID=2903521 RepID=UPI001E3C68C5|nr:cytochrome c [Halomonas sp. G15]MCE0734404.1 cytochrome c [Halomonas sp. G15]
MKLILAAAMLGGALLAMDAQAAGDAEAGADKIGTCVACHGTDGKGLAPIYPNLNGQSATYLEGALKAYRDSQRQGGNAMLMTPMAQGLSDEDIADIAAYYSSQE